jgi:GNAT superfamily N-acetyltransferase
MSVTVTDRTAEVVKATSVDVPELAWTLAQAFEDDPAMRYFMPDDSARRTRLGRLFAELALPDTLRHGETYATPDMGAGALWVPPGEAGSSLMETLRLIPLAASIFGGRNLVRSLRGLAFMESNHPKEPHWYLWILGVRPERQGEGVGSMLMRDMLDRIDDERMPSYLEATSPGSRDLYLRHGYEVKDEVRWPGGGPPLWLMWREAVT